MSTQKKIVIAAIVITCAAVLASVCFAPFALEPLGIDNSAYVYVASRILNGEIPYRDVLDHKGPFLYLINCAGLALAGGRLWGIWLLELASLSAAGYFMFKTARVFSPLPAALLGTVSALLFLSPLLNGGNTTEEWALPLISLAALIFSRHFRDCEQFSTRSLFLLAASFSLVLLLKPTLVAPWAGFCLLFIDKRTRRRMLPHMGRALLLLALFVLLALLPFLLCFLATGALDDAWYGIFHFNLFEYKFTMPRRGALDWLIDKHWHYLLVPFGVACAAFIWRWIRWRRWHGRHPTRAVEAIFPAFVAAGAACAFGGGFGYYLIILAPFGAVFLAALWEIILEKANSLSERAVACGAGANENKSEESPQRLFQPLRITTLCSIFLLLNSPSLLALFKNVWKNCTTSEFRPSQMRFVPNTARAKLEALVSEIQRLSAPSDKILVRGYASYVYLCSNRECATRFPYPLIGASRIIENYAADAQKKLPRLIIQGTGVQSAPDMVRLDALLNSHYKLAKTIADIEIWQLR